MFPKQYNELSHASACPVFTVPELPQARWEAGLYLKTRFTAFNPWYIYSSSSSSSCVHGQSNRNKTPCEYFNPSPSAPRLLPRSTSVGKITNPYNIIQIIIVSCTAMSECNFDFKTRTEDKDEHNNLEQERRRRGEAGHYHYAMLSVKEELYVGNMEWRGRKTMAFSLTRIHTVIVTSSRHVLLNFLSAFVLECYPLNVAFWLLFSLVKECFVPAGCCSSFSYHHLPRRPVLPLLHEIIIQLRNVVVNKWEERGRKR